MTPYVDAHNRKENINWNMNENRQAIQLTFLPISVR